MSWAEVKKINSDLTTPLDVRMALDRISWMGSSAINSFDMDMIYRMIQSNAFYTNEFAMNIITPYFFDYLFSKEENVGNVLNKAFLLGIDSADNCPTWNDCLLNQELLDALSVKTKFFTLHKYIDASYLTEFYGNSAAMLLNTRQGLYEAMYQDKSIYDMYVEYIRDTAEVWSQCITNAKQFLARQSHEYIADTDKYVLYVAIGAGGNGANGNRIDSTECVGGAGGDCGKYEQRILRMKSGDVFDVTIAADSTVSLYAGVNFGRGGGEAKGGGYASNGGVPMQTGKIIKVSSSGRAGTYSNGSSGKGGGGAAGYGGGDGGASGSTRNGTSAGGLGVGILNIVEGTGGAGGSGNSTSGASGTGGGGGGGGSRSNSSKSSDNTCGGSGGGGYGGGGGGGHGDGYNAKYTGSGGSGGSGGIIIFH